MATQIERFQTILEALKNGTVDQALQLRVVDAFVTAYYFPNVGNPDAIPPIPPEPQPEDLTNSQKASIFNRATRQYVKDVVIGVEAEEAAQAARDEVIDNPPDLGTNSA